MTPTLPLSFAPPGGWGQQKPPAGTLLDRGHSLAVGLADFWALNEAAGQSVRSATGLSAGSLVNAKWANSRFGPAVLNSATGCVDCGGNFRPSGVGNLTLFALVYPTTGGTTRGVIGNSQGGGNTTERCALYTWNSYLIFLAGDGTAYDYIVFGAGTILDNVWNSIALIWQPDGRVTLYNNAAVVGSGTITRPLATSTASWKLGRAQNEATYALPGLIACAGLWRRALSAAEVALLHREPYCMFAAGGQDVEAAVARPLVGGSLAA
jgi:hypothetical protein